MADYSPVVLFAYKRKETLEKCLRSLDDNMGVDNTELFIYLDGPRPGDAQKVKQVREFICRYIPESRFKKVTLLESAQNKGLANSIIGGVTEIINEYGRIIVVEDDLITSRDFLQYMNGALDYYQGRRKYGSVSAHTYPLKKLEHYAKDIYVGKKGECWGWGTWKDRWEEVDWQVGSFPDYMRDKRRRKEFDALETGLDNMLVRQMQGELDSWAVRWCYHLFINQLWTVYPAVSRTVNIGFDGEGTHCEAEGRVIGDMNQCLEICKFEEMAPDEELEKEMANYLNPKENVVKRSLHALQHIMGRAGGGKC